MKNLFHYLKHLFLNFTLIFSLILPSVVSAQTDTTLDQQKADCATNTAMEWSSVSNRCVSTAEAKKLRDKAEACSKKDTVAEREECHKALAISSTNLGLDFDSDKLGHESNTRTWVSGGLNTAYSTIAIINFATAPGAKSMCTSKKIFGVVAIGGLASDIYLKVEAQNKVDELKGKFKLEVENNASESQTKALTFLKDEQLAVVAIAEQEKKRDQILTAGYAAAGIMAAYELATTPNPDCIKPAESKPEEAKAAPAATATPAAPEQSFYKKYVDSSLGILMLSSIGAIYAGVLWKLADDQITESNNNIVKLEKAIKSFSDSYANFCPNGHDSLNEPKCYCYTEDKKQNAERTKSQTCIDLWAKDSYKLGASAGDYAGTGKFVDAAGCMTLNGKFDEQCKCKKFIDQKGANACMKTSNINIPSGLGSGFGNATGLQQVTNFSNNSANGNPGFNLLSSNQLGNNAISAKKMRDGIFTKLAPSLSPQALAFTKMNEKNVGQFARAAFGDKALAEAAKGSNSAIGIAGTRTGDEKTLSALKNAEQKAGLDLVGSGKGLGNKKSDGKESFNFVGDGAGSANGSQTQNFPETQKNYNFKNNDISKNSETSIFEIISNRYVQSGLKRLFDN